VKIKDLFKKMEEANKFAKMVGEEQYQMWISLDEYYGVKYESWKEFYSYLKNEYAKWYVPQLLEQDIQLDSKGCGDCYFECDEPMTPFNGKKFQGSIHIAICKKGQ
jgi:hypothetical protein